jgi:hypothetical protein
MIYDQARIIFRVLLLSICVFAAHAQDTSPGKSVKVQLLMWDGAFTPDFDSIRSGKSERVLFRKEVGIGPVDLAMRPLELLKKHLDIPKLKDKADLYWRGAVYRPTADGKSASLVYDRGSLRSFNLTDLKDGDVVVYFRETF